MSALPNPGYVLGPVTGDHWFVYVADKCDRPDYTATDRTVSTWPENLRECPPRTTRERVLNIQMDTAA